MRSMVSTCPRVGAKCYPPPLGISKEIMYRGPQVLDMEYREPDRLEHGPQGPSFHSSEPPLCQRQQHLSPRPSTVAEVDLAP